MIETARHAAQLGGDVVARYYREGVEMRGKQSYNLVSDADIDAERAVVQAIREAYPDHAILAEEEHHDSAESEHLWVVDPLDGTNNFAHHIPHFAVSIAYYHQGVAQCGAVYNPIREDWYTAVRGEGAQHNGQPIHVSDCTDLGQVLVGLGFYYDRGDGMLATLAAAADFFRCNIHGVRRFGTASLDLAQVACGMFGAFFEFELKPWDFGAGRLLVEEAGGRITTCTGEEVPLKSTSMLASNGHLHAQSLAITSKHFKS
ncbi:inositol monophosphatase family protein [Lignipirellula cremea]|uniref:Inositol-1-monophosphatase n=1 Tax=Lignipirellula cremea TaxID=2528010 RepID=A0A518E053_9BACT|nr:inositol monophosphatase family protein [Lignipirellula cremea]QDU97463.1 Inositol-1-monophosphatase [Lignipirellula cremea]